MSDPGVPMRIAAGRWVRHAFLRENIVGALKTFAWLGPLTLLIWVYAERAQVVPVENVSFPIGVQSPDPNKFVQLDPNFDGNVVAKFTGPRSRIEAIRQEIRPSGKDPRVVIIVDPKSPGWTPLDTKTIGDTELFRYSGVSIADMRPQQVNVFIDTYEEREVEVQVPANVASRVIRPAFTPNKVTVRAPSSFFQSAGKLTVEADLSAPRMLDTPGAQKDLSVRVYSPQLRHQQVGITYTPDTVKATLEVGALNRDLTIRSMPLFLAIPPGTFENEYRVTRPQAIYDVKVSGPPDKIAEIEKNIAKPLARLTVTAADAPGPDTTGATSQTRLPQIAELPEGVTVSAPPAEVTFSVERKSAP